jgi:hypothetical protein
MSTSKVMPGHYLIFDRDGFPSTPFPVHHPVIQPRLLGMSLDKWTAKSLKCAKFGSQHTPTPIRNRAMYRPQTQWLWVQLEFPYMYSTFHGSYPEQFCV